MEGVSFKITLDRPSELLVLQYFLKTNENKSRSSTNKLNSDNPEDSWANPTTTTDNRVYDSFHADATLTQGVTYNGRIMVKFDKHKTVPFLESLHLNGIKICPGESTTTSSENGNSKQSTKGHPDPVITESTIFDTRKPTTTSSPTGRPSQSTNFETDRHPVANPNKNNENSSSSSSNVGGHNSRPNNNDNNQNQFINNNSGGGDGQSWSESAGSSTTSVRCGTVSIVNPLVTNGQKTHHGQWPWHVALYKTEGINLSYLCGGSLVSKTKVITAAHCLVTNPGSKIISYKSLVIYLGKQNLRQYTDETGVQTKQVSKININPTFSSSNYSGDIAILTLNSEVEYTSYVRPVCIWGASNGISEIVNKVGVVAGWGLTENDQTSEELKMATLPVVTTEKCLRSYPKFYSEYLSDTSFCAGFGNGTSPCNGDSGGGLVFKPNDTDNTWYLRGIVSLSVANEGLNFCNPKYYVIFTDVSKYSVFIRKNID